MSSLIFITDKTQALIATDTLSTLADGTPHYFTSKALALPHLRMVIACTGISGMLERWLVALNGSLVIGGFDGTCTESNPHHLRAEWAKRWPDGPPAEATLTVYHFGWSEQAGAIRTFAYRSTNGFATEEVSAGVWVKPGCETPDGVTFPRDLPALMQQQREREKARPVGERVHIGGEIQVHHLTQDGCHAYAYGRFPDYDEQLAQIINRPYVAQRQAEVQGAMAESGKGGNDAE